MGLLAEVCLIVGITLLVMLGTLAYLCCKRPVFIALPGRACTLFKNAPSAQSAEKHLTE